MKLWDDQDAPYVPHMHKRCRGLGFGLLSSSLTFCQIPLKQDTKARQRDAAMPDQALSQATIERQHSGDEKRVYGTLEVLYECTVPVACGLLSQEVDFAVAVLCLHQCTIAGQWYLPLFSIPEKS